MSRDPPELPGDTTIDAMIARATAACERIRVKLANIPKGQPWRTRRLSGMLKIMEGTLARLAAERTRGRR